MLFVGLSFGLKVGWLENPAFSLAHDQGYSEVFQYVKEFAIGFCFALLLWKTRQPVYLVLSALFCFFLLDDSLTLHELAGEYLAAAWGLGALPPLRARDVGEVLFAGGVGAVALGLGVATYRRSDEAARRVARYTAGAVVVLAGLGVGVDLLHQALQTVWGLSFFLLVVEDGGELAVMSVITAGAVAVVSGRRASRL